MRRISSCNTRRKRAAKGPILMVWSEWDDTGALHLGSYREICGKWKRHTPKKRSYSRTLTPLKLP
jgi:hypothetical protein